MTNSRETLVMLPGMMCDERLFGPQIAALSGSFNIVPGKLNGGNSITAMAEKLLVATQTHNLNLLGLSMGGIVAMEMVRLAPDRIRRLALLDTNHLADPAERIEIRNSQIARVREGRLREIIVNEMKPNYLARANRGNHALLELLIEMAMEAGPEIFIEQSLALRDRKDQTSTLAGYKGPVLVLCGEEDELCKPSRHREIAGLPENSRLVIVKDAGHVSTLEQPEAVNDAIRQWLAIPAEPVRSANR